MKTSLVYVLTSSPSDLFYEQTLVSVWSARYWNPYMKIVLLVDDLTDETLVGNRTLFKRILSGSTFRQIYGNLFINEI